MPSGSDDFVPGRVEYAAAPALPVGLASVTCPAVVAGCYPTQPFGGEPRPTVVTERTALSIPAFWSAIRFLSETIAGLPVDVCRKSVGGVRQRLDGHPVETAFNVWANDLSDPFAVRDHLLASAVVWGNGYLFIDRDDAGQWTGRLFNLMPDAVRPFRFRGPAGDVEQWYAVWLPNVGSPVVLPAADVFHLMGPSPDGMCGYPVVGLMAENLRISRAAETFGARFFDQGGHLGGTIETEQKLTDDQLKSLRQQLNEGHTGLANAHKFLLLPNGAKAKTLALPPDTAQYIETRQLGVTDVCRMLRVFPWYVMDMGRATWGNAGQQGVDTVKYSLSPWIIKLEQQIARKLLTPAERAGGLFARFGAGGQDGAEGAGRLRRGHPVPAAGARRRVEAADRVR